MATNGRVQNGRQFETLRPDEKRNSDTWTTNGGAPVPDNRNSLTVGERGPVLLEDFHLQEKLANLNRERIPERVVHARGATAKGVFTVTKDITDLTCADLFSEVGKETPLITRFSLVVPERGGVEASRDTRGFAVKFYTQQGNWDLVGNNMPVFWVRDGISFPDVVHAIKPNPRTNKQEWWRIWDFAGHHPESTHILTWLLDDVGIPRTYRHMPGFGVHTFKLVNKQGKETYVKFHWIPEQGEENIVMDDEAVLIGGATATHATEDLWDNIERGNFPAWQLKIQTMDPATEHDYDFDPLDATKIWPDSEFPMQEVGRMVLKENPENFFAENEVVAFSPSIIVPGIDFSNDKLLQTRLPAYADAQRYRLSTNYLQLPVNAPKCPFHNDHYDGVMNPIKREGEVNYFPSFENKRLKEADPVVPVSKEVLNGVRTRKMIEKQNNFKQAGDRFRNFDHARQERFIMRVIAKLTRPRVTDEMRSVWFDYWTQADETLGKKIAEGCRTSSGASIPIGMQERPATENFGLPKLNMTQAAGMKAAQVVESATGIKPHGMASNTGISS